MIVSPVSLELKRIVPLEWLNEPPVLRNEPAMETVPDARLRLPLSIPRVPMRATFVSVIVYVPVPAIVVLPRSDPWSVKRPAELLP